MELQLKNIGMIKEANVKIDGLTVIAGENDTGKSTVGKVLLTIFYRRSISLPPLKHSTYQRRFKKILFFNLKESSEINFYNSDDEIFSYSADKNYFKYIEKQKRHAIFIETPFILNLFSFFSTLDSLKDELGDDLEYDLTGYPYSVRKLYRQLKLKLKKVSNIDLNLNNIINGEMELKQDNIVFKRENKEFNINSVATGIKSFGLLQLLAKNGYLKDGNILILDEPEVHLHPKWQLEMAKVIVELVKNGVKVLVNSHSPYMIEALKRYSELKKQEEKTNFYLAEDGYIKCQDNLENIFEKLALPMRELKKLKLKKYLND